MHCIALGLIGISFLLFEKYIDLTQKRQELNEVRKRMSQNENIQKYYQSYYKINELLDEVTKIVFKDISD